MADKEGDGFRTTGKSPELKPASRYAALRAVARKQLAANLGVAYTAAFLILVALVRLSGDQLREPRVNVPVLALEIERDFGGIQTLKIPGDADHYILVVRPNGGRGRSYDIEIADASLETYKRWSFSGSDLSSEGFFTLLISRKTLPAGEYRVRFFERGSDRPMIEHKLRVVVQDKPLLGENRFHFDERYWLSKLGVDEPDSDETPRTPH